MKVKIAAVEGPFKVPTSVPPPDIAKLVDVLPRVTPGASVVTAAEAEIEPLKDATKASSNMRNAQKKATKEQEAYVRVPTSVDAPARITDAPVPADNVAPTDMVVVPLTVNANALATATVLLDVNNKLEMLVAAARFRVAVPLAGATTFTAKAEPDGTFTTA